MKFDEKYFIKTLKELLDIDSVTGQYHELQDYLVKEAESLGFKTSTLKKGGVLIDLGGKGDLWYVISIPTVLLKYVP